MEYRSARIFVRNIYAGILRETEGGYEFQYAEEYLINKDASVVSLTLPLQKEVYFSKTLFAFFDGLIPEGWLLEVVIHNWKVDPKDRFGILLIACKDCIGTVSVYEEQP